MGKNIYDKPRHNSSNYDRPSETTSNIYDQIGTPNVASTFRDSESIAVSTFSDFKKPNLIVNEAKNKKSCLKLFNNRKFIVALAIILLIVLIVIGLVIFLVIFLNGKFEINNFFIIFHSSLKIKIFQLIKTIKQHQ